jgi:hypothetical protein
MAHRICYLLSGVMLPFVYTAAVVNQPATIFIGGAIGLFALGYDFETSKKASQG